MTSFTIIGTGSMGTAIGSVLAAGGSDVNHVAHEQVGTTALGDVVVLAVLRQRGLAGQQQGSRRQQIGVAHAQRAAAREQGLAFARSHRRQVVHPFLAEVTEHRLLAAGEARQLRARRAHARALGQHFAHG